MLGRAREKDNFLALLLNKSVSIATIQPAAGERERGSEREGKVGVHQREKVTMATEEEGEKGLGETLKKYIGRKCKRQDKQRKSEFTGPQ